MLIVALVLAVIGLAALVTAVVTSNELVAWVCIAASVIGVILLIVDAIRERQRTTTDEVVVAETDEEVEVPDDSVDATYQTFDADYPDDNAPADEIEVTEVVDTLDEPAGESKPTTN